MKHESIGAYIFYKFAHVFIFLLVIVWSWRCICRSTTTDFACQN